MDFNWLQYVGNPYTALAVLATVLAGTFRVMIQRISKPSPTLVIMTYGMFVLAIGSLALSVVAVSYLMEGTGAADTVSSARSLPWAWVQTAQAHEVDGEIDHTITGWIWAGEYASEEVVEEVETYYLHNATIQNDQYIVGRHTIVLKSDTNLRVAAPSFSWWRFKYVIADLITVLPPQILQVHGAEWKGKQLWLKVETIEAPDDST